MATTTAPQVETRPQAQIQNRTVWAIDPHHTLVEFSVRHMMFTTVKGRFGGVRGAIIADEKDFARSSVEVEIDAASIDTRSEARDAHLRSADFLDAEQYPTLRFKSRRVEQAGRDQYRVIGDLTIRDVTRETVLDMSFNGRNRNPFGQEVAGASAETTINRRDFGLTWNVALETGGVLVSDTIKIAIEVQAARES